MSKLFISYRRDETQDITARIHLRLAQQYGPDNIFIDIHSIPIGHDFRQALREAVDSSNVVLVIIGSQWLNITDDHGARRLDNPDDFVRIEVEAALSRKIPVVPVLTQRARIPHANELPKNIAELAYRHGVDVRSDEHFDDDVDLLISRLNAHLSTPDRHDDHSGARPVHADKGTSDPAPSLSTYDTQAFPAPDVLPSLAQIGFRGINLTGVAAIEPPVCTVAGGSFLMGSAGDIDSNASKDEFPQHWLDVPTFHIARYPVTVAEYRLALAQGRVNEPQTIGKVSWEEQLQNPANPVVCVTWQDAQAYAQWLAEVTRRPWRVATEAQWEKAARWDARSRTSRIYPWGNDWDRNRCNSRDSGAGHTQPVGSHSRNDPTRDGSSPVGAEDMSGNVWEWTSSTYESYPESPGDGPAQAPSEYKVMRGGSWLDGHKQLRAAYRSVNRQQNSGDLTGFRLALDSQ